MLEATSFTDHSLRSAALFRKWGELHSDVRGRSKTRLLVQFVEVGASQGLRISESVAPVIVPPLSHRFLCSLQWYSYLSNDFAFLLVSLTSLNPWQRYRDPASFPLLYKFIHRQLKRSTTYYSLNSSSPRAVRAGLKLNIKNYPEQHVLLLRMDTRRGVNHKAWMWGHILQMQEY
jgi:hypothetical protein